MNNLNISHVGLGHILANHILSIPIYQRSYAWKEQQVRQLLEDISRAMKKRGDDGAISQYFVGSLVVIKRPASDRYEVVDGQQRLATASIFIAAIRDYHDSIGDDEAVQQYEQPYLRWMDMKTRDWMPRLAMNEIDNECYKQHILERPKNRPKNKRIGKETSHKRLIKAYQTARGYIETIAQRGTTADTTQELAEWVAYLRNNVQVVLVEVADDADAFTIFETLNDRGLDLTIADLLKNYLFGTASPDSLETARHEWMKMTGALGTLGKKDRTVDFIRQLWGSMYGVIRKNDLFRYIRNEVRSKRDALAFASELSENAVNYAAILNTDHEMWNAYGTAARNSLVAIRVLKMERIRPLLLSIIKFFSPKEATRAIRFLEAAAVRLIIAGGRAGTVEQEFVRTALGIRTKEIRNTNELADSLKIVPTDPIFESSFNLYRVSNPRLARYLLMKLDGVDDPDPDRIINPDEKQITLEHILPQNDREHWRHMSPDEADSLCRRVGNLALMRQKFNNAVQGNDYAYKAPFLAKTESVRLTSEIPKLWPPPVWERQQIEERQSRLAKLALKAWPLSPPK